MPFKCDVCKNVVADGDVLVDEEEYGKKNEINWLAIVCTECTAAFSKRRIVSRFHSLWELRWIQNNSHWLLASVLAGLLEGKPKKWSKKAVDSSTSCSSLRIRRPRRTRRPGETSRGRE